MEPINFNDFIKSKTKNDLPVPTELNWDNMDFNLPPAKRKPRFILWMLCFLIGALGVGSVLWYVYQQNSTQSQSLSKNDPNGIKNQDGKVIVRKGAAFVDTAHQYGVTENTVNQNNTTNKKTTNTERLAIADKVQPQDATDNNVNQNNTINTKTTNTERLATADKVQAQDATDNNVNQNSTTNKKTTNTERLAIADKVQAQDARKSTVNPNNVINKKTIKTEPLASVDMSHPKNAGKNGAARNKVANKKTFKKAQIAKVNMADPNDTATNSVTLNKVTNKETLKPEQIAKSQREQTKPSYLSDAEQSNDIEYTKAAPQHQMEPSQLDNTGKINQNLQKIQGAGALINTLPVEPIRSASSESHVAVSSHALADSNTKHVRKSTRSTSLLVSIGTNYTQMNHSNARLNDAITPAWGNSYQILLEHELKKNWLLSIGLGYQRLHSTFYFEKDLGTFTDFSRFQIIRKTRSVFNNNYYNIVSLNMGIGKQFKLSPRLQGQLLMYISPSYRISNTGKSLDDTLSIIALSANTVAPKKWLLNADAAFRISYKIKKTDLILGINFSQSLSRSGLQTVGNSTTTVQPRFFGLNFGIKRPLVLRKK